MGSPEGDAGRTPDRERPIEGTGSPATPVAGTPEPGDPVAPPPVEPVRVGPGEPPPGWEAVSWAARPGPADPAAAPVARVPDGSGPGIPSKRTHRWGIGAFLLVELVFLVVSALVGVLLVGDGTPVPELIAVVVLVPPVLAAGLALLITRLRGGGPRRDLALVWSWPDFGIGLAFGIGGLVLTAAAATVYVTVLGPDVSSAAGDLFAGLRAGPLTALLVLLAVVVVVPFCEEILYRGMLWGALERLGANRWVCFALTTLIFALFHFEFTRTPLLLVITIPIGLARVVTGRLLASIVAHQVNNLLPGIALAAGLLGLVPTA